MNRSAWLVALSAAFLIFAPAAAAPAGDGGALQFRIGAFYPSGSSEFWDVNESVFTLDKSDFNDVIGGVSWLTPLNNFLEIGFNADFYDATARSAYIDFVDQDGFPILHDTRLRAMPLTVDLRVHPAGRHAQRGRSGRLLVRRPSFYVGAGAGMNVWEYEEVGDFVASDLSVVFDRLKDSGVDFEGHVLAGIELPVSPAWGVNFEGRYSWSEVTPGGRFADLDQGKLDLGGASGFVGATLRF